MVSLYPPLPPFMYNQPISTRHNNPFHSQSGWHLIQKSSKTLQNRLWPIITTTMTTAANQNNPRWKEHTAVLHCTACTARNNTLSRQWTQKTIQPLTPASTTKTKHFYTRTLTIMCFRRTPSKWKPAAGRSIRAFPSPASTRLSTRRYPKPNRCPRSRKCTSCRAGVFPYAGFSQMSPAYIHTTWKPTVSREN